MNDAPDFDAMADLLRAKSQLDFAIEEAARAVNATRVAENARFEALGRYHEALRKWQEAGS